MQQTRYSFVTFKDSTTVQVSEISHINFDKTSSNRLWKMVLKDGTVMFLTKSEYDSLLKALRDDISSAELVELDTSS